MTATKTRLEAILGTIARALTVEAAPSPMLEPRPGEWTIRDGYAPITAPGQVHNIGGPWCENECPNVPDLHRWLWPCTRRPRHRGDHYHVTDDGLLVGVWHNKNEPKEEQK